MNLPIPPSSEQRILQGDCREVMKTLDVNAIGIEISPEYVQIIEKRIAA